MSVVLMYHSVGEEHAHETLQVRAETLARHLRWVADEGYAWCSLREALAQPQRKAAALTFDDGFADVADTVERLRSESIPSTLFICPGLLGGVSRWTTSPATRSLPLLRADEVVRLARAGVDIAPHGWTHEPFTAKTPGELARDLDRCQRWFEEHLGFRPSLVSYPYGRCDATCVRVVETVYEHGIAVEPVAAVEPRFAVPRLAVLESSEKDWLCRELRRYDLASFLAPPVAAGRTARARSLARATREDGR